MTRRGWLTTTLVALAVGIAAAVVLGPLFTGTLAYRTSETGRNQIMGGDLAALAVVVPVTLLAAFLVWREHPAGPAVALAPGTWSLYMYAQLVVGQEYLDLPGNNERFFPLLLALFVLGGAVVALAWPSLAAAPPPPMGRRLERIAGATLLVVAAFLVFGLHLPSLVDALAEQPTSAEYLAIPTAFWTVKLMDLGIVVPAAIATGIGLLRGSTVARRASYVILGGYTLLGAAVAGMAVVMLASGDPDGTVVNVVAFGTFAVALGAITVRLYRPLFAGHRALVTHRVVVTVGRGVRRHRRADRS